MELETTSELDTSDTPCNVNSDYSYSKEGTDKLDLTSSYHFGLTEGVL